MSDLLARFEAGELVDTTFDHRAHLQVAVGLLRATDFVNAVARYIKGVHRLAAEHPEKVNVTVTVAFLSAIAERLQRAPNLSETEFISRNPELLSRDFLTQWYDEARLWSPAARRAFLMPEPKSCRLVARC